MPVLTFAIVKKFDAVWLCTTDGKEEKLIAQFVDEEAAKSFTDVLNLTRFSMHAMGAAGL
jgi:hypothetical protein